MVKFQNREDHKNYSQWVSSLNIDFTYLGNSLGTLFSGEEDNESKGEEVRSLLRDIASTASDLEKLVASASA